MLYLLLAVLVVSIPLLAVQTLLASITVFEYEGGLRFVRGRLGNELEPGRYRS